MAHNLPNLPIFPLPKFSHVWYLTDEMKFDQSILLHTNNENSNITYNSTKLAVEISRGFLPKNIWQEKHWQNGCFAQQIDQDKNC